MAIKENAGQGSILNSKVDQELKTQIITRIEPTKTKTIILKIRMSENQEKHKFQKIKKLYEIVYLEKKIEFQKKKKKKSSKNLQFFRG